MTLGGTEADAQFGNALGESRSFASLRIFSLAWGGGPWENVRVLACKRATPAMPPLEASPGTQLRANPSFGSMDILASVFDELTPSVQTLSMQITGCPESAEDLVQEVFLEELAQERFLSSNNWLRARLTERLAQRLDTFEPHGRNEPRELDLEEVDALPLRWTTLSEVQQSETLDHLNTAIALLPETYREVVRLSLMEGRNSQDIGIQLRRSPATVRSQLARGLDRLRQSLPDTEPRTLSRLSTGKYRTRTSQER